MTAKKTCFYLVTGALTVLLVGCGSSGGASPDSGAAAGGKSGSGGADGTGGRAQTGGAPGSGGTPGSGGVVGSGGNPGSGGAPGTGGAGGQGGSSGSTIDQCFMGLRALNSPYQIATKVSADGKTRVRVALEWPPDVAATSGSYPWKLIRFGIERDGGPSACVTDAARLVYGGTHHNCSDTATVTGDAATYMLTAPDRETTGIKATGSAPFEMVNVTNTTCMSANTCRSGGPC